MPAVRKTIVELARITLAAAALVAFHEHRAPAIDIEGVQPAAFTIPEVHALIQPAAGGDPYLLDLGFGLTTFNISPAYLDTGTSGIVISELVADNWMAGGSPVPRSGAVVEDVAIGGTVPFDVSEPVRIRIASSAELDADNLNTFEVVYDQAYGPMRVQIGPTVPQPDVLVPPNVFGMPVMIDKVVVIDPAVDIDNFIFQQTYIYDPVGPQTAGAGPGIPGTSHQVKLSYGDFSRFTQTTGGEGPQLNHNPLIGPNPLLQLEDDPPPDDTPPVRLSFAGRSSTTTMLFDTGAIASFISPGIAETLGIRYSGQFNPDGDELLEMFDPDNPGIPGTLVADQFLLPISGIAGGGSNIAGLYLDALVLETLTGSPDPDDPSNIRYLGAPVLVLPQDILLFDPVTEDVAVLDGIFGMNFLLASATLDLSEAVESPYRWITFDEPSGLLGLDIAVIPEPGSMALAIIAGASLAAFAWRRRRRR